MKRNKPDGVKKEDLDLWFSGCINDAIMDAHDAGLDRKSIIFMLRSYLRSEEEGNVMLRADKWSEKETSIGLWKHREGKTR